MKISVEHIAKLARLSVSEKEAEAFRAQLQGILSYMEKLNELDTKDVEPTSHAVSLSNVLREDIQRDSLSKEDALANAPDHTDKFYRVPRIIE
ncbi:MAG: Asp-tRNA(Asn)/Glu-tRNA(Gln) amidotransferase GatCAB subunit C [Nitrospirae bacterium CG_4_10_14_3_um_filter_44_29]|nr:Asp-tRNA(Asn)/Glu-tRNA(Gln) amidotransferase subunit GatC [Nitrospirota bacterium]OIO28706.1 MAG: asparaginyl/glutamyl-tRNA amidotransferase subunit C [Nitrospirae bacterium CG1_02_44_142]PIP70528.1 MAG: Asp-tRNA(Asn)/Glu-tRNA(Gln) amidotransferase GatCAB subunit C [Nitrospirae bacterium CG22_combo_CG10-13_8_21_14_all_44_11]PIV43920.1 MAG: Asp-tRNA(Asn)/Glu-tRNA(Gln) amidotransferase GatCAB subunit C [Nitrospirae bacterium CG02_land_8_20_14_3_00_44_33]PIV66547.1 MAG: Asp-tRNA(Asn)/Glu-tRNA(G